MRKEELVKKMVTRFLGWKLPSNFRPSVGIVYGTDLLDAIQAEAMVRHMIGEDLDTKSPCHGASLTSSGLCSECGDVCVDNQPDDWEKDFDRLSHTHVNHGGWWMPEESTVDEVAIKDFIRSLLSTNTILK